MVDVVPSQPHMARSAVMNLFCTGVNFVYTGTDSVSRVESVVFAARPKYTVPEPYTPEP